MPICAAAKRMGVCGVFCLFQTPARAQISPDLPAETVTLTVEPGVPLRLILVNNLPVKRQGEPVVARLVEPVFSVDREVVAPGAEALGTVVKLRSVPRRVRVMADSQRRFHSASRARNRIRHPGLKGWPADRIAHADDARRRYHGADRRSQGEEKWTRRPGGRRSPCPDRGTETRRNCRRQNTGEDETPRNGGTQSPPYHPQSLPAGSRF